MKTEKFDELFRNKLETMPQRFSETDIDRVMRHVRKNRHTVFRRQVLQGAAFGVMAVALAGMLIWNLYLHESRPIAISPSPEVSEEGSMPARTEIPHMSEAQPDRVAGGPSGELPRPGSGIPVDETSGPSAGYQNELFQDGETSAIAVNDNNFRLGPVNSLQPPRQLIIMNETDGLLRPPESREALRLMIRTPAEPAAAMTKPSRSRREMVKTKPPKPGRTVTEAKSNGLLAGIPTTLRAGAGTEFTGRYFALGVALEWKPAKSWGVETGLQYLSGYPERFGDEREFFDRRKKPFPEVIPGQAGPLDHFRNIRISLNILRLPVGLNYYKELGRDFTLSLGLSTAIDLDVAQDLRFDRRPPADSLFHPTESNVAGKPGQMNYLAFRAGLEKRWDRWSVYATPLIGVRFEVAETAGNRLFLGAGIGARYVLFR